jgi:hypothetical protein
MGAPFSGYVPCPTKGAETPDALALGPSTATISWGEVGIIVLSAMVRKYTVVKAKHLDWLTI